MADAAVKMAEAGCTAVAVLGVDFMSENVRAILDEAGHQAVQVYRMSESAIGCSLAEAAESAAYDSYLSEVGGAGGWVDGVGIAADAHCLHCAVQGKQQLQAPQQPTQSHPVRPRTPQAGATPTSLHVVYINTSLLTKATANALVPTITCTSSNVVQTILQAFAQVRLA